MTSVSNRFVTAMRTFDTDAMTEVLAAGAAIWRNVGNRTRTAQEVIEMLRLERALVASSTLQVRHESPTEDGFVVQLEFAGTTAGGADFSIPLCVVAHVADGRITAFEEYADEASLAPLLKEFLASAHPSA